MCGCAGKETGKVGQSQKTKAWSGGGGVLKNFGEGSDLTLFILQKDHSGGSAGLES